MSEHAQSPPLTQNHLIVNCLAMLFSGYRERRKMNFYVDNGLQGSKRLTAAIESQQGFISFIYISA